jgi:general secretion pathway protein A
MEYYEVLGLKKEPFLDTADPFFFYQSRSHKETLHRMEISLRLGRGLNLILGDVGTGKTTLAQALEAQIVEDERFIIGKMLDPAFSSEKEFFEALLLLFGLDTTEAGNAVLSKNKIKNFLFQKGVEEDKSVVLVIDEGQKLTYTCLEDLRLFLNYQTPQKKLLNIVIFSQLEILPLIRRKNNFTDRIAYFSRLEPFDREETGKVIDFRLQRAGFPKGKQLFTQEAKDLIHEYTKGRPRRIIMLCHNAIEEIIIRDKRQVTEALILELIRKDLERVPLSIEPIQSDFNWEARRRKKGFWGNLFSRE